MLAASCLGAPSPARAGAGPECGNGVVEAGEACDHGAANSDTGCCSTGCSLIDRDLDGLCDALDACVDPDATYAERVRLTSRGMRGGTLQRVRVEVIASLEPGAALDPARDGVRVVLAQPPDGMLVDAEIPPGSGWRGDGRRWRWAGELTGGVQEVRLAVLGDDHVRLGAALLLEGDEPDASGAPLRFGMRLGAAGAGVACREARFPATRCRGGPGETLRCSDTPRVPACRRHGLAARLECGVLRTAVAQERYYDGHGFYGARCTELPGFWQPPASVAVCAGSATAQGVFMASLLLPDFACCAHASAHELAVECGAEASCPDGPHYPR